MSATYWHAKGWFSSGWDHKLVQEVANGIVGDSVTVPQKWKKKRFDIVWVFDWDASTVSYSFSQVPQQLLAGDSTKMLKRKHSS